MKKIIKKLLIIVLLIIVLVWIWFTIKLSIEKYNIHKIVLKEKEQEEEKIAIDEYNFNQLEKVKTILDKLDKNSYKFDNIKEFSKKFNQEIKPIKNCYFLSDRNRYFDDNNWGWGYIFWFELESNKYTKIYWDNYYAYPKYDLPKGNICIWGNKCDFDIVIRDFYKTISIKEWLICKNT